MCIVRCLYHFFIIKLFIISDSNFVLGNAQASSFPIVYCSDGFCELTGFARAQIMGKSCACKFLYGADSDETDKTKIDEALEERQELKTEIYLYQRNSKSIQCSIFLLRFIYLAMQEGLDEGPYFNFSLFLIFHNLIIFYSLHVYSIILYSLIYLVHFSLFSNPYQHHHVHVASKGRVC